jgi:hypothetical protein
MILIGYKHHLSEINYPLIISSMPGETLGHEGQDFVAPDETTGVAQRETVELDAESQAALAKLDRVLELWNDHTESKSMTPYSDRVQEYQRNNIPMLENLRVDLLAGKTTFTDTSERPYRPNGTKIVDKLEEIYRGLDRLS